MLRERENKLKVYLGVGAIVVAALFWSLGGVFLRP